VSIHPHSDPGPSAEVLVIVATFLSQGQAGAAPALGNPRPTSHEMPVDSTRTRAINRPEGQTAHFEGGS
jgi:hypothetical protein